MKAIQFMIGPDGQMRHAPLPLPVRRRQKHESVDHYRRQASGEEPIANFGPQPSTLLRTISLSDGPFGGLATQAGPLLHFILSGRATLAGGGIEPVALEPGDIFLTQDDSVGGIIIYAQGGVRLLQIDVEPGWPGPLAELQEAGSVIPRADGGDYKCMRMYGADDGRAYFAEFPEILPSDLDRWTAPRPIEGFRMSCFPADGKLDFHPGVVNQIGLVLSGALELEVSGDGRKEIFHPGEMCLSQDKTGIGHRNIKHGLSHSVQIVVADEHLWPFKA
ncbi:hypothetical protein [Sphingobium sp.]|uniref:hypothetical protein n=1 Tax=Sphingobium sp. TaxID=1912891 RepID=UPI003B3BDE70